MAHRQVLCRSLLSGWKRPAARRSAWVSRATLVLSTSVRHVAWPHVAQIVIILWFFHAPARVVGQLPFSPVSPAAPKTASDRRPWPLTLFSKKSAPETLAANPFAAYGVAEQRRLEQQWSGATPWRQDPFRRAAGDVAPRPPRRPGTLRRPGRCPNRRLPPHFPPRQGRRLSPPMQAALRPPRRAALRPRQDHSCRRSLCRRLPSQDLAAIPRSRWAPTVLVSRRLVR